MATMARFVGLNTCLSRTRIRNFEPTATTAASAASASQSVRRSRQSESAEISALLHPEINRPAVSDSPALRAVVHSKSACAARALASVTSTCGGPTSKPKRSIP